MNAEAPGTTAPDNITVEQLAAQLTRKAPPGAAGPEASTPDPGTTPEAVEEAPPNPEPGTDGTETTTDLSQPSEAAPEAEPESPPEEEPQPGDPEWYQKRVAKFTARQKELEDRLAAAEKRAEDTAGELEKARKAGPSTGQAWNHAETQLQAELEEKRNILRWTEQNPDGATLSDGKGGELQYTSEQVREIKLRTLEDLGDLRGQLREGRQRLAQAKATWEAEAIKAYPQLKDPKHADNQEIDRVLESLPWLREVPDARISVMDMLAGQRLRRSKTAAKGKLPPAPTPARVPAAAAVPARTEGAAPRKEVEEARAKFQETGRAEDLARRFSTERKV